MAVILSLLLTTVYGARLIRILRAKQVGESVRNLGLDGQMQKPVYRDQLKKNNISRNPNKIYVKIGEIPEAFKGKDFAVNAMVIKNNFNCDYCTPSVISSRLYPLLPLQTFFDDFERTGTKNLRQVVYLRDEIPLFFSFNRAKTDFHQQDGLNLHKLNFFKRWISVINIEVMASVEGSEAQNKKLLESRRKSIDEFLKDEFDFPDHLIKWTLKENWELMYKQIEVNNINIEVLKNKSKSEIRTYLNNNPSRYFDGLLDAQRISMLSASLDTSIVVTSPKILANAAAFYDEHFNWDVFSKQELLEFCRFNPYFSLDEATFEQVLKERSLKTNLLGTLATNEVMLYSIDSLKVMTQLSKIDKSNNKQVFNFAAFMAKYWYHHFSNGYGLVGVADPISPEQLFELIKPLQKDKSIPSNELEKLEFNIYLSGILYYTAHNNWPQKERYFDEIVTSVRKQEFKVKQAEELALFFNFFHKFPQTITLLSTYFDRGELSQNGIFLQAETAVLVNHNIEESDYLRYMQAAKTASHERYCRWLNTNFQIQRNERIKQDFCKSCK
jgi:hypothetical protein